MAEDFKDPKNLKNKNPFGNKDFSSTASKFTVGKLNTPLPTKAPISVPTVKEKLTSPLPTKPQEPTNFKGSKGDIGPQGIKGDTGPKGPQGEKGPKGDSGLQGMTGKQGPKGDKGDKGDVGPQGPPGPASDHQPWIGGGTTRFKILNSGTGTSLVNKENKHASSLKSLKQGAGITITDDGLGTVTVAGSSAEIIKMGSLDIATPTNTTITATASSRYAYTINGLYGLSTSAGTIVISVKINGVSVTGLDSITVNSTPQTVLATALNTVNIGDKITFVLTSNSGSADLIFTMQGTIN